MNEAGEHQVDAMQVVMIGLGEEKFALDAGLVREIIDPVPVTKVAGARAFVPSVIIEIELDGEPVLVGVTADKVYEVTEISQTDVQQTPRVGMHWKPEFIRFIAKWREEFVIVPNMERILN